MHATLSVAMNACLSFKDLIEINRPQLAEMERVGSMESPEEPASCVAFSGQVKAIEAAVRNMYVIARAMARNAADPQEAADVWDQMGELCSSALRILIGLKDKFPSCGTSELYDLTLDYKLACEKRHKGILEEMKCQTMEFPEGLFPAKS
jgi:hypothetical protein